MDTLTVPQQAALVDATPGTTTKGVRYLPASTNPRTVAVLERRGLVRPSVWAGAGGTARILTDEGEAVRARITEAARRPPRARR